jgi:hypothetical protein
MNTATAPWADAAPSSTLIQTVDVEEVARIFDAGVEIVVLRRDVDPAIARYLDQAVSRGGLGSGVRLTFPAQKALPALGLPEFPGLEALRADVAHLVEIYGDLVGSPHVGLRVEITHQAMCPRFHVDRVGIRLLCTYRGPGTEWLADFGADRSRLGPGACGLRDEVSGLIVDPAALGRARTFDVVVLKGGLGQGDETRGAIHRSPSPAPAERPRVLLALDAVWD